MAQGHKVGPYYFQYGHMHSIMKTFDDDDKANEYMTANPGASLLDITDEGERIIARKTDLGIEAEGLDSDAKRIEFAISHWLTQHGVTFVAQYVGESEDTSDGKPWKHDAWLIEFSKGTHANSCATRGYEPGKRPNSRHCNCGRKEKFQTEYKTGLGHRGYSGKNVEPVQRNPDSILYVPPYPLNPHPAGVLYGMCLDAQAAHESFSDWCANFGYDSDSIKALNTYRACEKIGQDLRAFFGADLAELSEIVQGY